MISEGMRGSTVECKEKTQNNHDRLVQYISCSLHTHNSYAFGYFFCEILNFVNVVSGMLLRMTELSALGFSCIYIAQNVYLTENQEVHLIHKVLCNLLCPGNNTKEVFMKVWIHCSLSPYCICHSGNRSH